MQFDLQYIVGENASVNPLTAWLVYNDGSRNSPQWAANPFYFYGFPYGELQYGSVHSCGKFSVPEAIADGGSISTGIYTCDGLQQFVITELACRSGKLSRVTFMGQPW